MMEYIDPSDKYDVGIFNRNFKRVEDAINGGRPLDWLELPDISNETGQKVVALLHVRKNMSNTYGFTISSDGGGIVVDWGDGTLSEFPYSDGTFEHSYDYDRLEAPTTSDGSKQVILTISEAPREYADWKGVSLGSNSFCNKSMLRSAAFQAGDKNILMSAQAKYAISMYDIKAHNVKDVRVNDSKRTKQLIVTGTNLNTIYAASSGVEVLEIPGGCHIIVISPGSSALRELYGGDFSLCSSNLSLTNLYNLEKIELNGIRRKFTLTGAPLTREAIISLFESLGEADMNLSDSNRTLNLTGLDSYRNLTDDDKKIATDKGFIIK